MSEKNMVIKITATSDMSAANAELQALQDRERDIQNEMRKQQTEYQKQIANIQATVKGREAQIAAIDKLYNAQTKQQRSLEDELKKTKTTLTDFTAKMSSVNDTMAKGATQTPRLVTQLRAMKQELSKMEMEGIEPSNKGFMNLAIRAGQLEDQIGDTRQRVSILASDTKYLDAAMGLGNGLAGGFTVATSAAALLGGESEELQKAFFKVQAVMSILNGVNMVAIALNKDQALSVVAGTVVENSNTLSKIKNSIAKAANATASGLETAAENGSKIAKVGSTVAQWALNSAMLANPAVWLTVGIMALVGAFYLFSSSADEAKRAQEALNRAMEDAVIDTEFENSQTQHQINMMKANGASKKDIREKEHNQALKDQQRYTRIYNQALKDGDEEQLKTATDKMNEANTKVQQLKWKYDEEDAQERADANKKAADAEKAAHEKSLQAQKQRNQEIAQARKDLDDTLNSLMQDGQMKEIDAITTNYDRKIEAIKGNSQDEIELRKQLENLKQKEIQTVELRYSQDTSKKTKELELLKAQNASAGDAKSIVLKKAMLEKQSELDILAINQSKDSEELKAEKIIAIRLKLKSDLEAIDLDEIKSSLEHSKLISDQRILDEKYAAEMILASNKSSFSQKKEAKNKLRSLDYQSLDIEKADLDAQLKNKLITQEEYEKRSIDLKEKYRSLDLKKAQEKADAEKQMQEYLFNVGVELVRMSFDYKKEQLSKELEDLDQYYTTDAEEAKKNANKKLISEQALAQKKLEIKRKQAIVEKEEAAFNIILSTAQAIMGFLKDPGGIAGTVMSIAAGVMGTAQLAMVASKPLPKYAKGRKGGRGEFALVGELGPETMWIPEGASIIPAGRKLNHKTFSDFGVPTLQIPELPNIDSKLMQNAIIANRLDIDYNRLGKAVADNVKIPKYEQKAVHVNIDKSGIIVQDGRNTTTHLNKKYSASWN